MFESVHSLPVCCAAAVSGGRENVIVSLCSDGECSLHAINAPKCGKGSVIYGYYGPGWVEIREYFGFAMANSDKRNMHFHENAFTLRLLRPMDYHCTRRSLRRCLTAGRRHVKQPESRYSSGISSICAGAMNSCGCPPTIRRTGTSALKRQGRSIRRTVRRCMTPWWSWNPITA